MATKAQFEKAFKEFMDKTDWVQGDRRFEFLLPWGKHRADIMKAYIEHLEKRVEEAEHERDCHMDIAEHFKSRCKDLEQRAEAADAKLAELEKQKPYGYVHNVVNPPPDSSVAASIFKKENRHYGRPVFTRPAPAADLADLLSRVVATGALTSPEHEAIEAECCSILRNIEEAK